MLISPNDKILKKQFYYLNQSYKIKIWNVNIIREYKRFNKIKHWNKKV